MTYFIRWRFSASVPKAHSSEPFHSRDLAIQNAWVLQRVRTHELWIEDSEGRRIEADEIRRNYDYFAGQRAVGSRLTLP